MSLRDQLLKAGLVSAKEKRRVEQELRLERKQAQSSRESKKTLENRDREDAERAQAELIRRRAEERAERQRMAEATARREQANQILSAHAIPVSNGPQRFWHKTLDGRFCHRLDLVERLASDLRAGRAAVGARETLDEVDYVVVPREIALRVRAILSVRIVFFNESPPPDDPSERLL